MSPGPSEIVLYGYGASQGLAQTGVNAYLSPIPSPIAGKTMAKTNPLQFIQQVRSETAKIVWPSRRETMLTSAMVFVMSVLFATFFFLVDRIIRFGLEIILNSAG